MAEDLLDDDKATIPWARFTSAFILLFSFIPLSLLLGMARIEVGPRWFVPGAATKLIGYFAAYCFVLYFFFLWPILNYAAPFFEKRGKKRIVVMGLTLFLFPPLLSYAYYSCGGARGVEEWTQLLLTVLPSVLFAAIVYTNTRRHWLFVFALVATFFIPFYVINDVMANFYPVFQYYPRSDMVLYLRAFASLSGLLVAAYPQRRTTLQARI